MSNLPIAAYFMSDTLSLVLIVFAMWMLFAFPTYKSPKRTAERARWEHERARVDFFMKYGPGGLEYFDIVSSGEATFEEATEAWFEYCFWHRYGRPKPHT